MVGKTPRVRKNERERFEIIRLYCGCLPCILTGHLDRHATIEHVTESGRRVGEGSDVHKNTVGMCSWHHFGTRGTGATRERMMGDFGPSLAHGRITFEDFFGDEVDVLIPVQNFVLDKFAEEPWPEYNIRGEVARLTRIKWIDLNHASANPPSIPGLQSY